MEVLARGFRSLGAGQGLNSCFRREGTKKSKYTLFPKREGGVQPHSFSEILLFIGIFQSENMVLNYFFFIPFLEA